MNRKRHDETFGDYDLVNLEPLPDDIKNAGKLGEMKPCPFCGCETILTGGQQNTLTKIVVYSAFCTKCNAIVSHNVPDGPDAREIARANVVNKWNERDYSVTFECPICDEDISITPDVICGGNAICPDCHSVFSIEISLVSEGE